MSDTSGAIEDELIKKLKEKAIFSEYLPDNFNVEASNIDVYGQDVSYTDRVEPYSYYMSRFNKTGDKRMISIPEFGAYVALVNFLNDKKDLILRACIERSQKDENSFSRFINDSGELIDFDSTYGDAVFILTLDDSRESNEYEKERSVYINNMIYKIQKTRGAAGILHIDISEFYRNIYTHILGCIKLGIDGVKDAFIKRDSSSNYTLFNKLDKMVRSLNGARTNGLLVGPYISRILAESLLAVVDEELREHNLIFTRYADDYEIAVGQGEQKDDILHLVTSVFDRYYFRINTEKTFYEEYPFYIFSNYEKVIEKVQYKNGKMESPEIIELFNCFLDMEKNGEKGAVRYLLKSYSNKYVVSNKRLYVDYLINVICNDEKNMSLACKILLDEFSKGQVESAEGINDVLYKQLKYNIKNGNNLGVVWLVYVLVNMGYEFGREDVIQFLETKNELAIIILLEEQSELFDDQLADECWNKSNCWLMLYQIALRFKEKRETFAGKLNIPVNNGFYEKLFKAEFSFYKKTMVSAKTDLQATDQQVNSYTPTLPVIFDDDDWSDLLEV